MRGDHEEKDISKTHLYSALFQFGLECEQYSVQMTAHCNAPELKFRENSINFGECPINGRRDFELSIYNTSSDLSFKIECPSVSYFFCTPSTLKIGAGEVRKIIVTFKPKNLGRFVKMCDFIVNEIFNIPVRMVGSGKGSVSKTKRVRGLAATSENFNKTRKLIGDKSNNMLTDEKQNRIDKLINTTMSSGLNEINQMVGDTQQIDQYQIADFNKKKFNNFL